jgi:hypothetical protein
MIGGCWQFGFGDGILSISLLAAIGFKVAPSLPIFFTFLITLIGLWCWSVMDGKIIEFVSRLIII